MAYFVTITSSDGNSNTYACAGTSDQQALIYAGKVIEDRPRRSRSKGVGHQGRRAYRPRLHRRRHDDTGGVGAGVLKASDAYFGVYPAAVRYGAPQGVEGPDSSGAQMRFERNSSRLREAGPIWNVHGALAKATSMGFRPGVSRQREEPGSRRL